MATVAFGVVVAGAPAQAALTFNCINADTRPVAGYNWTDRCPVSTIDDHTNFVAELTGAEDVCDPVRRTRHSQRLRVVADWEPTGKLLIRSIDIRYLSGTLPWAYYEIDVIDGNGQYFLRSWNNYGNTIDWDGASDVVENTVHIVPNAGFAPTFGGSGLVSIRFKPHFTRVPSWNGGQNQVCVGDAVAAIFTRPA